MKLYAAILCGGKGERFWPRSRLATPKQFIPMIGQNSLTQETSRRIKPLCPVSRQLFVTPARFVPIVRRLLKVKPDNLVIEPVGRNTAPAIALAALYLLKRDPDATMVVLPADHLIENQAEFLKCVTLAAELAQQGLLLTFGIPPNRPDTGYGYIQLGNLISSRGEVAAHRVLGFKEKPDFLTAQRYLDQGSYVWNSGMFVWRADNFLRAVQQFMPEFYADLERFKKTIGRRTEAAALKRLYARAPAISVDYAIMEKATNIAAVRATFDWDDVGSWLALARHIQPDDRDNVVRGLAVLKGCSKCIVDSDVGIVALLGMDDTVVVRSGDAVLVARSDALDGIKELLARIAELKNGTRFL